MSDHGEVALQSMLALQEIPHCDRGGGSCRHGGQERLRSPPHGVSVPLPDGSKR
jgi:hypothetical protein